MAYNNLHKSLQSFSAVLNHVIAKTICEDLSWQRRNSNSSRFPLQDVAEVFEIRVSSANRRMTQLKGRNVGSAHNFVISVHASTHTMCTRVLDLRSKYVLVLLG